MIYVDRRSWKKSIFYLPCLVAGILLSCQQKELPDQDVVILAKVGDVTITKDEFLSRAEESIRPPYCNGDNNLHKKIVLNSLLAEKMLALEAGEENDLIKDENFQLYLQGRKEQAMREWLLHEEGFQKVHLDDKEIQNIYNKSGRTYKIQYYNVPDDRLSDFKENELINNPDLFSSLYHNLWQGEKIPEREIKWNKGEPQIIENALYGDENVSAGQVFGPVKVSQNNNLIIKVLGWTDQLPISEQARTDRWNEVKQKLTNTKAMAMFDKYVVGIMSGKKLEFNSQTFTTMISLIEPFYKRAADEKKETLLNEAFNKKSVNPELQKLATGIEGIFDDPFFKLDNKVWTVREFKQELKKHPLVFRKNLGKKVSFSSHFKYAIIDMMRDHFLTQEAYKRGYQNQKLVKRNVQMWKDAMLANYQKNNYLKNMVTEHPDSINEYKLITDYLNPYIDRLQGKYGDQIEVNVEQFNKIKLSRIDMVVVQRNRPFQVMVPGFPQVTTDSKLDYGRKMK